MDTIVNVFQYYSSNEGDKVTLNRRELKNLLRAELSSYLQEPHLFSFPRSAGTLSGWKPSCLTWTWTWTAAFVAMMTELTVCSSGFFQDYTTPVFIKCGQMKDGQFQVLWAEITFWFEALIPIFSLKMWVISLWILKINCCTTTCPVLKLFSLLRRSSSTSF